MAEDDAATPARESLSQFLARVLDQLTITSWLPALMLVAISLVLSRLAVTRGSLQEAFEQIGDMGVAGIVFLVAGVILAAMFAQAFEFESIRIIEGYWPRTGRLGRVTAWRQQRQLNELRALSAALEDALEDGFASARKKLRKEGAGAGELEALERYVLNERQAQSADPNDLANARKRVPTWKNYADPRLIGQIDDLDRRKAEFPSQEHRVLPTRFGNVVRAVEERVHDPSQGRLENFVIHVIDQLPRSIALAYYEQRRRLDLYCGLTFVFAASVPAAIGVAISFKPRYWAAGVAVPLTLLLASAVSYRAAMASGRKFGYALSAVSEHQKRQKQVQSATASISP